MGLDHQLDEKVQVTYKYRIYPSKEQEKELFRTIGVCKGAYNIGLYYCIERYRNNKEHTSKFDLNYYYKELASTEERAWLKTVHSQILQNVSSRIMAAFNMFFKKLNHFPKFKGKHDVRSFTYPQSGFKLTNKNKKIYLSGIGNVKIVYHRPIIGKIKTCTVYHNACNQWFVSFVAIQSKEEFYKKSNATKVVGIDLGLDDFLVLSDGYYVPNQDFYRRKEKKIKKLSRRKDKKQKGSRNREKARLRLAKAHQQIKNRRSDFLWKLCHHLVNNYLVIGLEDIESVSFMTSNHSLAKSEYDVSWSMFRSRLEYESYKYQTLIGFVDKNNTTQNCCQCGKKVQKDISVRTHKCPYCGIVLNRDLNAAINILNRIPKEWRFDLDSTAGNAGIHAHGDTTSTTVMVPAMTPLQIASCIIEVGRY